MRTLNNSGMQENEFEKQVKHLMDDFNVAPPGETWQEISRKLNTGRRKRLPFIFLLIFGLIITGALFFYKPGNKLPDSKAITNANNNTLKKDTATSNNLLQKNSLIKDGEPAVVTTPGEIKLNNSNSNKNPVDHPHVSAYNPDLKKGSNLKNDVGDYTSPQTVYEKPGITSKVLFDDKPAQQDSVSNVSLPVQPADTVANNENIIAAKQASLKDSTAIANAEKVDYNNASKTVTTNKKASKWQWGINAFYGRNDAVEGLTATKPATAQDVSFNSPTSIIAGDTVFNKYPYTTSGSFSIGFDVQRKISKNIVIGSGLNFIRLSTKSDVRQKINSTYNIGFSNLSVNSYYQPGVSKSFTNDYNFIELPVYIQQNLLHIKRFGFGYNAGISLRQLVSSDALIYNSFSNVYFSKNELLRKTQFQAAAGLNFSFNTGKSCSIYIGPQVSYSLSNFMKNADDGNYHFITYGLKAGVLLHKK